MFKVIMQKHVMHDISFWEVVYAKHCFVYYWEHKNLCLYVFIVGVFKQAVTKVFKVIMQLSFICEMARKHTRILQWKRCFYKKINQSSHKINNIAKVLLRDHQKIKRHVTTSQQRHKKHIQPKL